MRLGYEGLKERLVLPFVLLGYIISAVLSLVTFALVAQLEERAVEQFLSVEIERFRIRRLENHLADPPVELLLHIFPLPTAELPTLPKHPPGYQGIERVMTAERNYTVLIGDVAGKAYAFAYDREYVDARLARLALFLLIGTGVMTFASFLIGNHLAQRIARPLRSLLHDIDQQATPGYALSLGRTGPIFEAREYPANEIGALAHALDQYAHRLHGFIERESFFAADVSHELRTPIAAIQGAIEVMLLAPDFPCVLRNRAEQIQRNAVRAGEVLEAMLILAREKNGREVGECRLEDLFEELLRDASERLKGRPVSIHSHYLASPVLPVGRPLVYVLVSNLLRNACAYTREGTIQVTLTDTGFEIQDTGIGISGERFPKIFERLEKGQESTGSGLGLSIVSRVAEYLQWSISVSSEENQGTCVKVRFLPPTEG